MKKFGKWRVIRSLAEGGQSYAYLVTDSAEPESGQPYVLKRLKNPKRIERFKKEIEASLKLEHPNIVRLINYDLEGERPYLVTEFCEGGDLQKTKLPFAEDPAKTLEVFRQICEGVAYAHREGVIHRDLKPANILLRSPTGPAVVADFGICFLDAEGQRVTMTEEAVGPRLYMAPELEEGRLDEISAACDVYSLGKMLYWLLTGEVFAREKHRDPRYDLVKKYGDGKYEFISRLLDRMITINPKDRLQSAAEVLKEVEEVISLLKKSINPIGAGLKQQCIYCGIGTYVLVADANPVDKQGGYTGVRNFGFQPVGAPIWKILVCNHCGNAQIFRPDESKDPKIWD